MSHPFPPTARAIFTNDGPVPEPVPFVWRSITRKGRPFLLLPEAELDLHLGLGLYSAQRKRAKVSRALLPMIFRSPAKIWFQQIRLEADGRMDLMRFMSEQSGVPVNRLKTPGVKFGGAAQRSRLALLIGDKTCRPVKVIKVGLNPAGRSATDREADLLEKLPAGKLGCIRLTGRLSTPDISAFSTDFFPGISPTDDAGMELLFHSWLNPGPPQPIESLPTWQEMWTAIAEAHPNGWEALQTALGGKKIRTALFHGDFAPWNISAVNSRNLQVFDWERGHLQGIPGWDWFHFIVQTSILARRLSVERIAAELEQLIHSDRFRDYARAAGISDIVKPLLLAYLLHHKWVNKPMEGGATTARLYEFLTAHWRIKSLHANAAPLPAAREPAPATLWASARCQLKSAAAQWINLFWEPSLSLRPQSSVPALVFAHWRPILLAALLLTAVAITQYFVKGHLVFLPLYLAVCALLTWQAGRRAGVVAATLAATLGPLMVGLKDEQWKWFLWNSVMRFIILQMSVLFVGRLHEQKDILRHETTFFARPVKITDYWAVLLASGVALIWVTWLDYITDPRMNFLPLYLIPCTVITLVTNLRWGIIASLVAVADSTFIEYNTYQPDTLLQSFGWNFTMRFLVYLGVILLVNAIRKRHILFSPRK